MFHICLWQDAEHELQISGISGIVAWESKLPYSPLLVKCIPYIDVSSNGAWLDTLIFMSYYMLVKQCTASLAIP